MHPELTIYISRIKEIAGFLIEEFEIKSLRIFGSFARGEEKPDSDLDLCVEMPPKALKIIELKNLLQNLLGRQIDIIRMRPTLDPFILKEINRDSIPII